MDIDLSVLDQIILTHFHIDHTSDLPAIIIHLYMNAREEARIFDRSVGERARDDSDLRLTRLSQRPALPTSTARSSGQPPQAEAIPITTARPPIPTAAERYLRRR